MPCQKFECRVLRQPGSGFERVEALLTQPVVAGFGQIAIFIVTVFVAVQIAVRFLVVSGLILIVLLYRRRSEVIELAQKLEAGGSDHEILAGTFGQRPMPQA